MLYVPSVIEQTARGERAWDLFSRLLQSRIIFIGSEISDLVASLVMGQLLYLQSEDSEKHIEVYINSAGGEVPAGLAIYDTMQLIRPQVSTICVGMAASMATVLLCAGVKGKRFALPHATIHMHQAIGGAQGQAADIVIAAKEIMRQQDILKEILVKHTGQALDKITHDTDRDFYLNPQQAVEYGLIDEILVKPAKDAPKGKK